MRTHSLAFLVLALAGCASSPPAPALDAAGDRPADESAAPPADPAAEESPALAIWERLREKYDANRDRVIAPAEYPRGEHAFARLDADRDGTVTAADFAEEWNDRPIGKLVWGEGGPALGQEAPNFRLETTRGETIELASFRGKRPVALVFGSFT